MSEDKKDLTNESIEDILKDFQAKKEDKPKEDVEPVSKPKANIDFAKNDEKPKVKREKKPIDKAKLKSSLKLPIIIVLIIAVFFGAIFGIGNAIKSAKTGYIKSYEKKYPSVSFPANIEKKYCDAYAKNQNLAGYITIKDIGLKSQVLKKADKKNTPYIENSLKGAEVFNHVVYLNDNSLESFYSSADSYNNTASGFISFSDLNDDYNFKVVAAYYTNTKAEDDNGYIFPYNVTERQTPQSALDFLDRIKNKSLYSTGITVTRGDTLLTVSCPTDFHKDFRFVVVGVARDDDKKLTATSRSHIFYPQVIFDETGEKNYFNFTAQWYPTVVVGNKNIKQSIKDYE